MNFGPPTYFSGSVSAPEIPLERYLPPYQPGVLSKMLQFKNVHKGWVLDPIGSHPLSAIELAKNGYQVLVAVSNPLLAKLYEVVASAPTKVEIQAAISEFGALRIGDERLEMNIKKMYESDCPICQELCQHVRFIWKKGGTEPNAKELSCTACGFSGESEISQFDRNKLKQLGNIPLYESSALQRVLPGSEDPPALLSEVIQSYLPRSLAVISRLMNKNDSYSTTPKRKMIIESLLILAFDYGTMLWGIPSSRSRPKAVSIPNQFWEFNLWDVIENGEKYLSILQEAIPFSLYPQLPPEKGGICLFPNRIRRREDLTVLPKMESIVSILPRPNQALWTYSVVWAGWIWGHNAISTLKGVLERKRYDWIWHTFALKKLFEFSAVKQTPWLATAPELTSNYLLSFVSAPASSGYQLSDFAYNPEAKSAQLYWSFPITSKEDQPKGNDPLQDYLRAKGEEASYHELLSIKLLQLAHQRNLLNANLVVDSDLYPEISKAFENTLKTPSLIRKVDKDTLEYGEFWLPTSPETYRPLADQIEIHFLQYLQIDPIVSFSEIESVINHKQAGILPAPRELLQNLLNSYCDPIPGVAQTWQLRNQETSMIRRADIRIMQRLLGEMGKRIGMTVDSTPTITWHSTHHFRKYQFFVSGSCIFSRFLNETILHNGCETVIVYPGSRADLLNYKIKRSLVLANQLAKIHFVKFRHVRNLHENPGLNLQTWEKMIDSDPAIWQDFGQPVLF